MLKRNIRLIHGQDSQQVLEVQYAEITHFKDNFTLMATVSALLAGFVFMVFGLEAEQIGEYSKVHATSVAYMVAATGSLCANVLVVCLSTLASMLGPGLALRGPEGSVARALEGMRDEHDRVVRLFLFGVYSFFCTVVCLAWFEYEWPVAAPVSALVLGGIVALRRGSRQLARRFALGEEKAAGAARASSAPKPPDAPPPPPPPAGAAPAALEKRGLLQKRGHVRKNWTTRFFEVADGALTYRDREGGRMLRSVLLGGETITCAPVDAADGPTRHAFVVKLRDKAYELELCAASDDDVAAWVRAISRNSHAAFRPTPLMSGALRGRRISSGVLKLNAGFFSYAATLTCERLALADDGGVTDVRVARAEAWDGRGRLRAYAPGFAVVEDGGARWEFSCESDDDRDAWLRRLRGCCGSHEHAESFREPPSATSSELPA